MRRVSVLSLDLCGLMCKKPRPEKELAVSELANADQATLSPDEGAKDYLGYKSVKFGIFFFYRVLKNDWKQ